MVCSWFHQVNLIHRDQNYQRYFYVNTATGQSQWEPPMNVMAMAPPPGPPLAAGYTPQGNPGDRGMGTNLMVGGAAAAAAYYAANKLSHHGQHGNHSQMPMGYAPQYGYGPPPMQFYEGHHGKHGKHHKGHKHGKHHKGHHMEYPQYGYGPPMMGYGYEAYGHGHHGHKGKHHKHKHHKHHKW